MNVVKALLSKVISFYVPISSAKGHCFLTPSTILQAKDNSFWFNLYLFDYQRTQTLDTISVASAIFFSNRACPLQNSQNTFIDKCIFTCTVYDFSVIT